MYVLLNLDIYDNRNIFYEEKKKNNVISDCYFIGLFYSTTLLSMNNIVFLIELQGTFQVHYTERYIYTYFNDGTKQKNRNIFERLVQVEKHILNIYKQNNNVTIQYNIENQIDKRYIKIYTDQYRPPVMSEIHKCRIALRISGIWENKQGNAGIIYKFMFLHPDNVIKSTYPSVLSNTSLLTY